MILVPTGLHRKVLAPFPNGPNANALNFTPIQNLDTAMKREVVGAFFLLKKTGRIGPLANHGEPHSIRFRMLLHPLIHA